MMDKLRATCNMLRCYQEYDSNHQTYSLELQSLNPILQASKLHQANINSFEMDS
jgi:hypothetical protein